MFLGRSVPLASVQGKISVDKSWTMPENPQTADFTHLII